MKKKLEEQVIQKFPHRCPYCDHAISYDQFDTFDGAKPRFLNRGKKRRSVSTLSIPRALTRGVERVDLREGENEIRCPSCKKIYIKVVSADSGE
jgi:DNA-directed RNA polymerase subunit RPC12/RpoP